MRCPTALLATALFAAMASSACAVYEVGDTVDDFTLTDTDGISHSLYDYRGQIVVLNFGEFWCDPCIAEWEVMKNDFWIPNKDQGVMIFTVGRDTEAEFIAKANQYSGGFDEGGWPWMFQLGGALYREYSDTGAVPYNVILDQEHRLVWGHAGWYGNFNLMQSSIDDNLADVVVHQLDPLLLITTQGAGITLGVTLTNRTGSAKSVQAVLDGVLPGHYEYEGNPLECENFTLPGDTTLTRNLDLMIPGRVPRGSYRARIGLIQGGEYKASTVNYITID